MNADFPDDAYWTGETEDAWRDEWHKHPVDPADTSQKSRRGAVSPASVRPGPADEDEGSAFPSVAVRGA